MTLAPRTKLLVALLALTAALPRSSESPLTPEAAMALLNSNSRAEDLNRTLTNLGLFLPPVEAANRIGAAAAGPCGGGTTNGRPAIDNDGGFTVLEDLEHDAQLADCPGRPGEAGMPLPLLPPPLLLTVPSEATPLAAARRLMIRRTWGSRRGVALAFFLGRAERNVTQAEIDAEARQYRDLVQFRIPDGPAWSTKRHLATLAWALTRCKGARHIVRVEDTVFVDTPHLTTFLSACPPAGILCSVRRNEAPQRSRKYLWYVSEKEFPGSRYPDFCKTVAYALSNETALQLLLCAALKPPVWIDDVYVTGILREAAGVPLTDFSAGHGFGQLLPRDSRSWGSASDFMFLASERPEFIGVYWPGLWRSLLLRECSKMMF